MEPIKNNTDSEVPGSAAVQACKPDQKVKTQVDRVTFNKNESEKVNNWLRQIKESSKGFLELTKSDLVNFLIKSHLDVLSVKEIKKIRLAHYSLIKHLNWITPQLKKALDENDHELVFSLQSELRGLEIGVIKNAESKNIQGEFCDFNAIKKQRVKKSKNKTDDDKNEGTPD
ncbi:MAG: hypothetical protein H7235_06620 [Bdellovibrionaceae bacterium]|nr:hypothetical protein [Pseudobdellovibrionaceae bacterium]